MPAVFLALSAVATLVTAFTHSFFGERRLIGPLVASNDGVMGRVLAKQVLRFAWHLTSLLWLGQAALLIAGVGALHLLVGVFDGVVRRGQHIGWPLLTAIGAFALLSLA